MTIISKIKNYLNLFAYLIGIKKRKGTLVYLGLHKGISFAKIFYKYERSYGFEANPELIKSLPKVIKLFSNVHIYNKAVSDTDGEILFNISNNNNGSSSIGTFKKEWNKDIKMIKTIKVPSINLLNFLKENHIERIDEYVSDIQGFDLQVLKTLKPMIDNKQIRTITCETTKDEYGNIYENAPDNSFTEFQNYLGDNYTCVSKGWGILKDGVFNEVPESWWEFDTKWRLKDN